MSVTAIGADIHQHLDILSHFLTKLTLNFVLRFDNLPQSIDLIPTEILDSGIEIDICGT